MRSARTTFVVVAALVAACVPALAQKHAPKQDSAVALHYQFHVGSILTYRVYSFDTIAIYDSVWRTVARERMEIIMYRCDSVLPHGFVITATTTAYHDTERRSAVRPAEHGDHPWRGRAITFVMTSQGRRVGLMKSIGPPGSAPGGPFEPLLLPYLGPDSARVGDPANFSNDAWLFDNVYPPIKWDGSCLRTIDRRFDTLGESVAEVGLTEVANTIYRQAGKDAPRTHATTNGGGLYYFADRLGYPVGGEFQIINRFKMDVTKDRIIEGSHITSMMFELQGDRAKGRGGRKGSGSSRHHRG